VKILPAPRPVKNARDQRVEFRHADNEVENPAAFPAVGIQDSFPDDPAQKQKHLRGGVGRHLGPPGNYFYNTAKRIWKEFCNGR
jgi:hypothetical protein